MRKYKGYLLDLDGTIYQGGKTINEAVSFVKQLQKKNIPFLFLSNNTTKSLQQMSDNLKENHDLVVSTDHFYTPSQATAKFLNRDAAVNNQPKTVYCIGEIGLINELQNAGFEFSEDNASYVAVALNRNLTYQELAKAMGLINNGATFVGTNMDRALPTASGFVPGAGSVIELLKFATRVKPIIIGKPETIMYDDAVEILGVAKQDLLMIGDNYDTDILGGINAGIDTAIVFTGVSSPEDVDAGVKEPTLRVSSLAELDID